LKEENADLTFLKYCPIKFQEIKVKYVGFEDLTAVVMKSTMLSKALLAT
jgi:hypothetical protein